MKFIICFLFINVSIYSQWNVKKISYETFYKTSLEKIIDLKKANSENFNIRNYWHIAELYEKLNIEDSTYANYYKIFEYHKTNKIKNEFYFETLLKLHETESSKANYNKDRRFFLNLLKKETLKEKNDKWEAFVNLEIAKDYHVDNINIEKAIFFYNKALKSKYAKENIEFQSKIFLNLGNLYTYTNDFSDANQYLNSSINLSKKINDNLGIVYSHINYLALYKKQNKYQLALKHIDSAFNLQQEIYLPKIYRLLYANKADIYEKLGDEKLMQESDILYLKLDSLINDFQKNSNFYEIDSKYQLKDKNQQILSLNQKFNQNKILYLTLIFLVFLLALYSFIRWKKEDRNKKIIEDEKTKIESEKAILEVTHHQTIDELQKTKELVIEDHIILKNKTKIYLENLIYIVADDHYLNFITTHKKEFIRGKITEIIQELPPNFVKCHRSYIVNKNYIKSFLKTEVIMQNNDSVPVSRNFKFN